MGIRASQEGIRAEPIEEVVRCMQAGTQSIGHQRLLCSERKDGARKGFVCQDQGHPRQVRFATVNSVSCTTGLVIATTVQKPANAVVERGVWLCALRPTCCARVDIPYDASARPLRRHLWKLYMSSRPQI